MTASGPLTSASCAAEASTNCWTNLFPIHQNNNLSNSTSSLNIYQHNFHHQPLYSSMSSNIGSTPKSLFVGMCRNQGTFDHGGNCTSNSPPLQQQQQHQLTEMLKTSATTTNAASDISSELESITTSPSLPQEARNSSSASLSHIQSSTSSNNSSALLQHQQQQQQQQQQQKNPKLYKTELCRSWADTGRCNYGERCQYAHGENEKRPIPRHPKYKTEACQSYHKTGYCPYGPRCHFIHNEEPHVIASLVAANSAACNTKSTSGLPSIPTSGAPPPQPIVSTPPTQNLLRQINPIGHNGLGSVVGCNVGSAPSTPHHSGISPITNNENVVSSAVNNTNNNNALSSHSPPLSANALNYNHYSRNFGVDLNNQHQSLTLTQSAGEANNLYFSSRSMQHGNSGLSVASSTSAAAFFIGHPSNAICTQQQQPNAIYQSQQPQQPQQQQQQQLLPAAIYKQNQSIASHQTYSFHPPSVAALAAQQQQLSGKTPDFASTFNISMNASGHITKSLDGGDSSPSSSLASADSGTESPELGSGSADSGGGFSPGLELNSTPNVDLFGHFTRLSPDSFRRQSSMLIEDKNSRLSFSSLSTIMDKRKEDEGRNSDGSTVLAVDDFLSSPTNSLFATTPNDKNNFLTTKHKLSSLVQNLASNLTLANDENDLIGDGIASAVGNSIDTATDTSLSDRASSPSILLLQNLQSLANQRNLDENFLFGTDFSLNSKNWSTIDLPPTSLKQDSSDVIAISDLESLRRASDSSLGSTGAPGVTTPVSSSAASASLSADELWATAPTITPSGGAGEQPQAIGQQQNSSPGIRLPVFERLSNGP